MNLTTPSHKIWPMRATAGENDVSTGTALLDLTTAGDFASKPATGVLDLTADSVAWTDNSVENVGTTHDLETNGIEFFIAGSTAHSRNAIWYLTAWRNENGPARRVAEGTCTTGTQAVVTWPHNGAAIANTFWCDTIVVTYENWPKEIEGTDSGNSNSVASLFMDACGYRYWMMEFRTTEADATALTNLTAFYGRF